MAHDNRFNRWVAGNGVVYFSNAASFASCMDDLTAQPEQLQALRQHARARFQEAFTWPDVLAQYEALLTRYVPA